MSAQMVLLPVFVSGRPHFRAAVVDGRGAPAGAGRRGNQGQGRRAGTAELAHRATQVGNSFKNQFELPLLFYTLIALALAAASRRSVRRADGHGCS